MAITVISTSRYFAVQYTGGDEDQIAQDVGARSMQVIPPDLILVANWLRSGQLIQNHTFTVRPNWWVVWTDMDMQYVLAVLSPEEFADQYQEVCDCATVEADIAALEASKVDRAGDTMTGDLAINADLAVSGSASASFQGVSGNLVQMMATTMSTCVYNGGEITPNVDPTKVDIAPATVWIFNYNSTTGPLGPTNPQLTIVNYPGVVGLTPAFTPFTYYSINSAGTLVQQATRPTAQQRRQMATVGLTLTQAGVIVVDQSLPVIPSQLNNQLCDLMEGMGPFSTQGNVLSSNGISLTFQKSAGTLFSRAFNQIPDYLNPHNTALPAQVPVNFRHVTALIGSAGPLTTLLNVGFYDPGGAGVLTPVGGGANSATNFRVWGFANNTVNEQILVQYGQNTYASLAAATAGLGSGNYIPQPATASGALLGWISVIRTATNLSDPTQATFTKAAKFDVP